MYNCGDSCGGITSRRVCDNGEDIFWESRLCDGFSQGFNHIFDATIRFGNKAQKI